MVSVHFVHVELLEQDVLCKIAGWLSLVPLTAIIPPILYCFFGKVFFQQQNNFNKRITGLCAV